MAEFSASPSPPLPLTGTNRVAVNSFLPKIHGVREHPGFEPNLWKFRLAARLVPTVSWPWKHHADQYVTKLLRRRPGHQPSLVRSFGPDELGLTAANSSEAAAAEKTAKQPHAKCDPAHAGACASSETA